MDKIRSKYQYLCQSPSDINEHLPTLFQYATECTSVLETGVRGCVSSWALAHGLLCNPTADTQTTTKRMLCNDIVECNMREFQLAVSDANAESPPNTFYIPLKLDVKYIWKSNLELEFAPHETYDLVFIDTMHCYGQLRRELAKFAPLANKYLIMHDTTIDEVCGEIHRFGLCDSLLADHKKMTGFTDDDDILLGLGPAIDQFLAAHPHEWILDAKFTNNNGLTVLKKIL